MGDSLKKVFIFATGLVIGSVATYKFVSEKEKARSNAEIADMEAYYKKLYGKDIEEEDSEETVDVDEEEPDTEEETIEDVENNKKEYKEMAKTYSIESPCVIEPGEFGEVDYYEQVYLTYYSNGVITNDISGDVVTDIDELIGVGSLDDIGKYEDDILHVRNDELEIYFEITAVDDKFEEE